MSSLRLPRWLRRRHVLEISYLISIGVVALAGLIIKSIGSEESAIASLIDAIVVFSILFMIGLILRIQQQQTELLPCEIISDPGELYNHFLFEVGRSEQTILLSHVRHMKFSKLESNHAFQSAVREWASDDRNQRVLRIVAVTDDDAESNQVAAKLAADSHDTGGYHLRGLAWNPSTPMTNFAIFDYRTAFICFYDGRDETDNRAALWALRITDSATVQRLSRYFLSLWEDRCLIHKDDLTERFLSRKQDGVNEASQPG